MPGHAVRVAGGANGRPFDAGAVPASPTGPARRPPPGVREPGRCRGMARRRIRSDREHRHGWRRPGCAPDPGPTGVERLEPRRGGAWHRGAASRMVCGRRPRPPWDAGDHRIGAQSASDAVVLVGDMPVAGPLPVARWARRARGRSRRRCGRHRLFPREPGGARAERGAVGPGAPVPRPTRAPVRRWSTCSRVASGGSTTRVAAVLMPQRRGPSVPLLCGGGATPRLAGQAPTRE